MLKAAGGKKTELAKRLGVSTKTVDRWLDRDVDVSEEKVRVAARAFSMDVGTLLVAVGYYAEADVPGGSTSRRWAYPDLDAESVALVESSGLPPKVQEDLLEELRRMAQTDAERRRAVIDTALRIRHA